MRNVLLGFGLILLSAGLAGADENDLSAGIFICHHDPEMIFSLRPSMYCEIYVSDFAIEDPQDQNPAIMTTEPRIWFLLTAFPEEKRWCGTEFGFGDYEPYLFVFTGHGPCTLGDFLEIPTSGWPGPNEGVAIVTTNEPWFGHLEPVYYFEGYAYYYPGVIPVDVDPPTAFAGWGNCLTPPESFGTLCFPGMGIMTEGVRCEHLPEEAACCIGEECFLVQEDDCLVMGGEWYPGEDCGPDNPCLPRAVCCVCADCYVTTEPQCWDLDGEWHRDWLECDPNPCPPSPSESVSWGRLKAICR